MQVPKGLLLSARQTALMVRQVSLKRLSARTQLKKTKTCGDRDPSLRIAPIRASSWRWRGYCSAWVARSIGAELRRRARRIALNRSLEKQDSRNQGRQVQDSAI